MTSRGHNSPPPDWEAYGFVGDETVRAEGHWAAIAQAMGERLNAVTSHTAERLVIARVLYFRAARSVVSAGGLTDDTPNGGCQQSALIGVMNKQAALAAQLEGELLLSPRKQATSGAAKPEPAKERRGGF